MKTLKVQVFIPRTSFHRNLHLWGCSQYFMMGVLVSLNDDLVSKSLAVVCRIRGPVGDNSIIVPQNVSTPWPKTTTTSKVQICWNLFIRIVLDWVIPLNQASTVITTELYKHEKLNLPSMKNSTCRKDRQELPLQSVSLTRPSNKHKQEVPVMSNKLSAVLLSPFWVCLPISQHSTTSSSLPFIPSVLGWDKQQWKK